jgi:hypothetical protein
MSVRVGGVDVLLNRAEGEHREIALRVKARRAERGLYRAVFGCTDIASSPIVCGVGDHWFSHYL